MKRIVFLFPLGKNIPTGGLKVVYDYINKLVTDGHHVTIVYAAYFKSTDQTIRRRIKAVAKYVYAKLFFRNKGYTWYDNKPQIEEIFVWKIQYNVLPKADIYVATAVCTAPYVSELPVDKNKKFYFIQDYESFVVPDDKFIRWTYRLPLQKIVISKWLQEIVSKEGEESIVIPNGFDASKYKLTFPIEKKDKYLISMLYHINERKDIGVGIAAVILAKKQIPQLKLVMFGAYAKPENLPSWISYYRTPSPEKHLEINNKAAIYVGCSKIEGWGLTVGEAMLCGQAVACTDIDGYKEMATDGLNALMSPVGDAEALAVNIVRLVNDDELRYRLAKKGLETIKAFDLEKSSKMFCDTITK